MKNSRNSTEKNRYSSLTAYICVMIAVASLGVFAVLNLETVIAFLSRLMGTLSPLIVGFVIAYLVNPFMKLIEEKLLSRIPLRIGAKLPEFRALIDFIERKRGHYVKNNDFVTVDPYPGLFK